MLKKTLKSHVSFIAYMAFLLALATFSSPSFASKENSFAEYKQELERIENYLNNIKNLSAKFIQESEDGAISEGKFLLSRPGKMRIEYSSGPKVLVIVNASVLSYNDTELEETSYLSTNTTPASLLTRNNISFSAKDVEVTNVVKSGDRIKVSLVKKNRKEAGEFTLIFGLNPLAFLRMEVKNDLGEIIKVSLSDLSFPEKVSSDLFFVKNKNLP